MIHRDVSRGIPFVDVPVGRRRVRRRRPGRARHERRARQRAADRRRAGARGADLQPGHPGDPEGVDRPGRARRTDVPVDRDGPRRAVVDRAGVDRHVLGRRPRSVVRSTTTRPTCGRSSGSSASPTCASSPRPSCSTPTSSPRPGSTAAWRPEPGWPRPHGEEPAMQTPAATTTLDAVQDELREHGVAVVPGVLDPSAQPPTPSTGCGRRPVRASGAGSPPTSRASTRTRRTCGCSTSSTSTRCSAS